MAKRTPRPIHPTDAYPPRSTATEAEVGWYIDEINTLLWHAGHGTGTFPTVQHGAPLRLPYPLSDPPPGTHPDAEGEAFRQYEANWTVKLQQVSPGKTELVFTPKNIPKETA